jgi:superfamily II DNA/RNA helicase
MEKNKIESYIGKNSDSKNHEKKIFSFSLTPELIEKLNEKIGYNSRSETVNQLILEFVNKKDLVGQTKPTKTTSKLPTRRGD